MEMTPIYKALYLEEGGPPKAYMCLICEHPTKTEIGIVRHLIRIHKLKLQIDFEVTNKEEVDLASIVD